MIILDTNIRFGYNAKKNESRYVTRWKTSISLALDRYTDCSRAALLKPNALIDDRKRCL